MAVTLPAQVELVGTEWRQISAATVQSMQSTAGSCLVIFSDTQPPLSDVSNRRSHRIHVDQWFSTTTGGTSWGRTAVNQAGRTLLSVTED